METLLNSNIEFTELQKSISDIFSFLLREGRKPPGEIVEGRF